MKKNKITRREFQKSGIGLVAGAADGSLALGGMACTSEKASSVSPVVSIARMKPTSIDGIEIRGEQGENVQRNFIKPTIYTWQSIREGWGFKEI